MKDHILSEHNDALEAIFGDEYGEHVVEAICQHIYYSRCDNDLRKMTKLFNKIRGIINDALTETIESHGDFHGGG